MDLPIRLCILFSGGGTTATAIYQACKNGILSGLVEIALAITNKPKAGGIERLAAAGVQPDKIFVLQPHKGEPLEEYGEKVLSLCREHGATLIGQYGWTKLTPNNVVKEFLGRSINQHPGPLDPGHPGFGGQGMRGLAVHEAVLSFSRLTDRLPITKATAQRVGLEYDCGAVLHERPLLIRPDDTAESLSARLLPFEHLVQIETLLMFAENRVREIRPRARLIDPEDIPLLDEAMCLARAKYPHG